MVRTLGQDRAPRELASAACPGCGGLHPSTVTAMTRAARQIERAAKLRVPFAIGAALLTAVVVGALGARDLDESKAGLVVALGAAIFAAAGTLALFLWPTRPPTSEGVWFWWNGDWRPAPPVTEVSVPPVPGPMLRASALGIAGIGCVVAIGGLVAWLDTVESVTIVFDDPTAITVRVDGEPHAIPNHPPTSHDIRWHGFTVRTGRAHRIEITANGTTRTFDLDATRKRHGWLLAATARPVCFFEESAVYGRTSIEPQLNALRPDAQGAISLPRSYDRDFSPPPVIAKTSNGSASKWALRATSCDESVSSNGELVPYRMTTTTTSAAVSK